MSLFRNRKLKLFLARSVHQFRLEWPVFINVNLGIAMIAVAVVLFVMPNRFPDLGVTGIAVLSHYLLGISPVWVIASVNVLLLIWGWKALSPRFVLWTTYSVFIFTVMLKLFEYLPYPPLEDRFMVAMIAGFLKGVGGGLIYRYGVSAGGTDIPGMVLRKNYGVEIGQFNIYINFIILAFSYFVVGLEATIYGAVSVYVMGVMVDQTVRSFDRRKQVFIITRNPQAVSHFILHELNRGVTMLEGKGGYSGQERPVLLALLASRQTAVLKNYLSGLDPKALMSVCDATEVMGTGFKPWKSL